MGYPMAGRLCAAGYKLVVADLNSAAVATFCSETGSTAAENLQQLGSRSDIVITMLPEGNAVRKVLLDPDAVVSGLKPGAVLLDMSSCSPVDTRILAAELQQRGFDLVDAPVSGGVVKAGSGGLAIMAGGTDDAIAACRPVLEVLGKVFVTGGSGTGHAMKALNNFLSAATLALTSEAVITGTKFGLDPAVMVDIINASTGRSNSSEHKFPAFILPRTFDSGFFLGLMAKDLRFAKALSAALDTPDELLSVITSLWDRAEAELGFHADNTDIHKYLEARSNDSA
jgi:3-hydroxyisobutyrate dehydrogenase